MLNQKDDPMHQAIAEFVKEIAPVCRNSAAICISTLNRAGWSSAPLRWWLLNCIA